MSALRGAPCPYHRSGCAAARFLTLLDARPPLPLPCSTNWINNRANLMAMTVDLGNGTKLTEDHMAPDAGCADPEGDLLTVDTVTFTTGHAFRLFVDTSFQTSAYFTMNATIDWPRIYLCTNPAVVMRTWRWLQAEMLMNSTLSEDGATRVSSVSPQTLGTNYVGSKDSWNWWMAYADRGKPMSAFACQAPPIFAGSRCSTGYIPSETQAAAWRAAKPKNPGADRGDAVRSDGGAPTTCTF